MQNNTLCGSEKNIFLLVSGLFPQIVTETIYAFFINQRVNFNIPSEVHLITTVDGANVARLQLLAPNTRFFAKLLEEYDIPNITFDASCIHVIKDENGQELSDIRTPEQNTLAANFISQFVQQFTSDPMTTLHVSLAGGRKTMGYYVGYALSLFGRLQDTLSHVLVSEAFENNRDFFFPTKHSFIIYDREGLPIDAKQAKVDLAEIPFVRLRGELPKESLMSNLTFNETVQIINSSQSPTSLVFDLKETKVICNGIEIMLDRILFCFYFWLAYQKKNNGLPMQSPYRYDHELNIEYKNEFKALLDKYGLWDLLIPRTQEALDKNGMERNFFETKLSNVSKDLTRTLGNTLAQHFIPTKSKQNKQIWIDLPLDAQSISFNL